MESTKVLKGFRGKRGLSQEQVANMLGMTRQTYNSIENDILHNNYLMSFELLEVLELNELEQDEFFNAVRQDYMSYKQEIKEGE